MKTVEQKECIQKAIDVMERVQTAEATDKIKRLHMGRFQSTPVWGTLHTEDELLHSCGSTACFLGWLTVSPEGVAWGLRFDQYGFPFYSGDNREFQCHGTKDTEAILYLSDLFGVARLEIHQLVFGGSNLFKIPTHTITPAHVISILQKWRDE